MPYAEGTKVTKWKSVEQIENLLRKHGADKVIIGSNDEESVAQLLFRLQDRFYRFTVPIPAKHTHERNKAGRQRTEDQVTNAYYQEERRLYRALLLVIKSKLEATESGIETIEEAFLSHMILPDNFTVYETINAQLEQMYSGEVEYKGNLLLEGPKPNDGIVDGEIVDE